MLGNTVTHRARWDVDTAIGWLHEQATNHTHPGDTGWHNRCLGITAMAYGYLASGTIPARAGRSGWAIEAWEQADPATKHKTRDVAKAPRGAIIHWRDRHGGPGHTGISNGDGTFWTNDLGRDGYITREPIEDVARKWNMKPVGWREPDFRRGVGHNPATPRPIEPPREPATGKPTRGVTTVVTATRARKRPGRGEEPLRRRNGEPVIRKPGHRVVYTGVRIVVDPEHGREVWLNALRGWVLAKRTKRGG